MSVDFIRKYSEFTPAQAANLTGVSTTLQRDWRRRGLLKKNEDGRQAKFSLEDIIVMSAMRHFSAAGVIIKSTDNTAQFAVRITLAHIEFNLADEIYTGEINAPGSGRRLEDVNKAVKAFPRYLVRIHDEYLPGAEKIRTFASLSELEAELEDLLTPCFVVVDLRSLAEDIIALARCLKETLMSIHVVATGKEGEG